MISVGFVADRRFAGKRNGQRCLLKRREGNDCIDKTVHTSPLNPIYNPPSPHITSCLTHPSLRASKIRSTNLLLRHGSHRRENLLRP
ncbi:hypothetical protein L6452_29806 [Arctium lappa]|uniref:Uncharacterized protein n=1 Tax=Arctium lappa TaxID=4217 RepID=A0ACB8ZH67_ARCLA|nr:hypothetical protein L6452_29806 [Arctium lappa]